MNIKNLLQKIFQIRPGEEKKVFLFLFLFALLIAGTEMGAGVSLSYFLKSAGKEKLPLMFLIVAIINFSSIVLYMYLTSRKTNTDIFYTLIGIGLLLLTTGRLLVFRHESLSAFIIYSGTEFLKNSIQLHFGVYVSDYFTTRQAKRLFNLIFAGSRIGGITGGLLLLFLPSLIKPIDMIFLWIFLLLTSIALLHYINNSLTSEVYDYEKSSKESSQFFKYILSGFHFFKRSPLIKYLALGVFFIGFLSVVMKFLYNGVFDERFSNVEELASFLGMFTIFSNIVGFFIQVFFANWLIDTLGIGSANLFYAFSFASGFLSLLSRKSLGSAMWGFFTDEQLESAVQDPVETLLYNAVPDNERARAKAMCTGLIKPFSECFGSLALMVLGGYLTYSQAYNPVAVFGFIGGIIFIYIASLQNKGYVNGLMSMLKDKTLSLEDLENLRWEKASPGDLEKLYRMSGCDDESLRGSSTLLLLHLDEEINFDRLKTSFFLWGMDIQQEFLDNYFRRSASVDEKFLESALERTVPQIKICIIEYFIENHAAHPAGIIAEFLLQEEELELQNSALRYFLLTELPQKTSAQQILEERMKKESPHILLSNLSLIGKLFNEEYIPYVMKFLHHYDRRVSNMAGDILARIYQPRYREFTEVRELLQMLIKRGGYHDIKAALTILGKKKGQNEKEILFSLLSLSSRPLVEILINIIVSNYSESEDYTQLLEILESPYSDLNTRENVVRILKHFNKHQIKEKMKTILKDFIGEYYQILREQNCLQENKLQNSIMAEISERKKLQMRVVILEILGYLLHQKVVVSIEKALITSNPRLISNAMELFENLWDKKQAKLLINLLYPENPQEELKVAEEFAQGEEVSLEGIIKKYLDEKRPLWDIYSAMMLIHRESSPELLEILKKFKDFPDPLAVEIYEKISAPIPEKAGEKMLTTIEKVIYLKNAPLFKSLKMDELKVIADICREINYSPGELIIEKGDLGNSMFIIASGEVEIFLPGEEKHRLAVLKESEFFGEMALFGDDVRSASAGAMGVCRLLCIEREHFINLIYEKPEISVEMIKVLSGRLRKMDQSARTGKN